MCPTRSLAVAIAVLIAIVSACDSGSDATGTPTGAPPSQSGQTQRVDIGRLAIDAAATRRDLLLGAGIQTDPLVFDWNRVQTQQLLIGAQNTAFCNALDNSHAGDALASLVALGLNALSLKLRHKPLPDDTDDVLGLAATFATASCPLWIPVVNPPARPAATPEPDWRPAGFLAVIGDSDLVWRWSDESSYQCAVGVDWCWQVDLYARNGCASLVGILAVHDADGVVLATEQTTRRLILPELVTIIGFGSTLPNVASGTLTHLICT